MVLPALFAVYLTLLFPRRNSLFSNWRASRSSSHAFRPSMKPAGIALGARMAYLQDSRYIITGQLYTLYCFCIFPTQAIKHSKHISGSLYAYHVMCIPLPELGIEESVGETFSADANSLKNSVAPQLVKNQVSINQTGFLHLIGDDTADKVGRGVP